jgi:ribosomal protein L37AE/L43A
VNDVSTANGRFRPSIDKKEKEVFAEEKISLNCPYCGEEIYESLSWFKRTYFTCPACQKGLAAAQFDAIVTDIEAALDARIEEDVKGAPSGGCCHEKHSAAG